jgi:hypothetical protein
MLIMIALYAPVCFQYWPVAPDLYESVKYEDGRRFLTFQCALRVTMTEECLAGKVACLLTASGVALRPDEIP